MSAPRHHRVQLVIHITFEPTRLAAEQLTAAYDSVLPERQQRRRPLTDASLLPATDERTPQKQEGA
jgi:hypothetical protein